MGAYESGSKLRALQTLRAAQSKARRVAQGKVLRLAPRESD
ncbi:hypothetical protein SBV1_860006 [Verrucomicrobia bacterium]|nr:hypothetical protein SBV1_860006 [Verrucomicrobiota bacterium]